MISFHELDPVIDEETCHHHPDRPAVVSVIDDTDYLANWRDCCDECAAEVGYR